jgi:hypothetical protein
MVFNESFIKKGQALIAAKRKKPPGLTPVAFKGAWLLKPSLPRACSLLKQSQYGLS